MNKAYQTMRSFWLDAKNLQHKQEVPQLGTHKICIAGVEMAAVDRKGGIKHFLIAASSLGNASIYFENNSASGLGGFTGGSGSGAVREKALRMVQAAAKSAEQLTVTAQLDAQQNPEMVTLFAISSDGEVRASQVAEAQVRSPEHPLYGFFAYSQQLLGAFRSEQEAAEKSAEKPTEKTAAAAEKTE